MAMRNTTRMTRALGTDWLLHEANPTVDGADLKIIDSCNQYFDMFRMSTRRIYAQRPVAEVALAAAGDAVLGSAEFE